MTLGKTLKELRNREGLTQKELSQIAHVTPGAVSAWEKGERVPRASILQRIADHFGLDVQTIKDGTLEPEVKYQFLPPNKKRLIEAIKQASPEITDQLINYLDYLESTVNQSPKTKTK